MRDFDTTSPKPEYEANWLINFSKDILKGLPKFLLVAALVIVTLGLVLFVIGFANSDKYERDKMRDALLLEPKHPKLITHRQTHKIRF